MPRTPRDVPGCDGVTECIRRGGVVACGGERDCGASVACLRRWRNARRAPIGPAVEAAANPARLTERHVRLRTV